MSPTAVLYVAQAIHGLAYGMLLFLVASGLTMIFGMMGILNIAHASFAMLSAYFCYQVLRYTGNFWLALLIAPVVAGICGVLTERFLLRTVHKQGHLAELLITVGIMALILEIVKLFWGTESLVVTIPQSLRGLVNFSGLTYPIYRLFIIGLSVAILGFMALILFKTRLGKIVRATVSDADMASALGINTPLVFMLVFGIGIWLGWRGRGSGWPTPDCVSRNGRPIRDGCFRGCGCGRIRESLRGFCGRLVSWRVKCLRHPVYSASRTGPDVCLHGPCISS